MAAIAKLAGSSLTYRLLSRHGSACLRRVATTSSQKDNPQDCEGKAESPYKHPIDFSKPLENKNWVSYGYDFSNKDLDTLRTHSFTFWFICVFLIGGGFIITYYPDRYRKAWAAREAFIRLHERESQGLDPVDMNYVDPSKIILPSDEELEELEIII